MALAALPAVLLGQTSAAPHRVLVLYWGSSQSPTTVSIERGFQAELSAAPNRAVEYYAEYFEDDRFPGEKQDRILHDYLRLKYSGMSLDAVVGSGMAANDFLDRHRATLFPGVPRVFIGPPLFRAGPGGPGTTGIALHVDYGKRIDLIRRLHPETNRVFVVSGTVSRDNSFEAVAREELTGYSSDVEIIYLTDLTMAELLARVRAMPPRSVILYVWQQVVSDRGSLLENADIIRAIAPVSSVPIYGTSSVNLGRGIVGGELFSQEENGRQAARIALMILDGSRAEDIPVESAHTSPKFDWRQLRRWNIPEDQLPEGSVLEFREPTLWERYQWYFLATAAFCALQAALIVALLLQRASRKRAELTARARQRELTHLSRVATLGELTGTLWHEIGQPLTSIMMNARAAQRMLAVDDVDQKRLKGAIDDIVRGDAVAFELISRVREMLKDTDGARKELDVNAVVADSLSLLASELEWRDVRVTRALAADLPVVLGNPVELQQVLLNLVINACDAMSDLPAASRVLTVRTRASGDGVWVAVMDRGRGLDDVAVDAIFEPFFTTKLSGLGLGLVICRRIIAAHRGDISGRNNEGGGATFHFSLPGRPATPTPELPIPSRSARRETYEMLTGTGAVSVAPFIRAK